MHPGSFIKSYVSSKKAFKDTWTLDDSDLKTILDTFATEFANCFDGDGKTLIKESVVHTTLKSHTKRIQEY